jgi:hypothetical protein
MNFPGPDKNNFEPNVLLTVLANWNNKLEIIPPPEPSGALVDVPQP